MMSRAARRPGRRAVAPAVCARDRDGILHLAGGARRRSRWKQLRDMLLACIDAEHREHDYRAVTVGDLDTCSIDGSLTRVPDSDANREAHSGRRAPPMIPPPTRSYASCGSAHASTRAALAVVSGPSGAAAGGSRDKGEAEQVLLDKALRDYPHVFTRRPDLDHGQELPRRPPDPADARHRHARADPRQGRHHPAADRGLRTRRLLPGQPSPAAASPSPSASSSTPSASPGLDAPGAVLP